MILPATLDWDEAVAASDQELADAYMADGMTRDQAKAYVFVLRNGGD